jgi:membrane protease YdiL (CAAX protease family)
MLYENVRLRDQFQALAWWWQFCVFVICAAVGVIAGGVSALVLVTLALLWLSGESPDDLGLWLSGRRVGEFAAGVLLGSAMVVTTVLLFRLSVEFRLERNPAVTTSLWVSGVWFYLRSSVFEEVAFRGFGFQLLIRALGLRWAQALTAVVFAIYHVVNVGMPLIPALLFTGLGSLLFGYAFYRTRGVMLPIGLHTAWNFWQEHLAGTSGRGQPGIWSFIRMPGQQASFAFRYGALLAVSAAAALIIHYSWRRKWAMERVA